MSKIHNEHPRWKSLLRRILFLGPHTCPWWFGYTFDNPLRRLVHDPQAILGSFVGPGQTAIDIGCGLGYFSIALARIVGPGGKVIALDVQSQMIQRARRRAECQGLVNRIDFRICKPDQLGVTVPVDFVLAFWVIHEVIDPKGLLIEIQSFIKPHGQLLIAEPKGHVSASRFSEMVELARLVGYKTSEGPLVRFSRSVVCSLNI
ncbi:MAG: class I SAM-dependent methyltransferase [Proteobacteria bacterium]|nr:class I SAM-dependent methyltransferase [Pseudomonadota bacterium]MCG2743295.1 class I SAM-dependent methyltransferase [Desulfobacteraceae bacterium]MBU4029363.1 class I SAM-dependent methyltransferase [Pseudomonadota bacterium]MBU4042628.1 class I SAM-dependent methyltransferase [Pseudomonadota bacterium]MBU4084209.1 class I SAM-dependent methyltransferase [Pseudomonadota bacterium]